MHADDGAENEMFDSSHGDLVAAAAAAAVAYARTVAEHIVIPPGPHSELHPSSLPAAWARHGCVRTLNCTHWLDWILLHQDILLTRQRVKRLNHTLDAAISEDPLTTRQSFTVRTVCSYECTSLPMYRYTFATASSLAWPLVP
jgi:hypothetical protein